MASGKKTAYGPHRSMLVLGMLTFLFIDSQVIDWVLMSSCSGSSSGSCNGSNVLVSCCTVCKPVCILCLYFTSGSGSSGSIHSHSHGADAVLCSVQASLQSVSILGLPEPEDSTQPPTLISSHHGLTLGTPAAVDASFFDVLFETNPLDGTCDARIQVSVRPLETTFHAVCIKIYLPWLFSDHGSKLT